MKLRLVGSRGVLESNSISCKTFVAVELVYICINLTVLSFQICVPKQKKLINKYPDGISDIIYDRLKAIYRPFLIYI